MTITATDYRNLMLGARTIDELYGNLNMQIWNYDRWCFDDNGVHYIFPDDRPAWNARAAVSAYLGAQDLGGVQ